MKRSPLPAVALGMLWLACSPSPHPESQPSPEIPPPKSATVQGAPNAGPAPQNLDQLLAGKLSGVTVMQGPAGGIIVRMMGPSSFYNDQDPLYVVDGTPVETRAGNLPWINPRDVESITALKNPSDIAIYGVRGANGVIVIKTKKSH
jgi:TonB-dependent SusC/RagA subfamily outer membrane receptor